MTTITNNPNHLPKGTMFIMHDPFANVGQWEVRERKRPYAVCRRSTATSSVYGLSYHKTPELAMAAAKAYAKQMGSFPPPDYVY